MATEIRTYADLEAASRGAAELVAELGAQAVDRQGVFTLALAGGSTPRRLYELLAAPTGSMAPLWDRTHLFWGDERCLPPERPERNSAMAAEILGRIPIPAGNMHPVPAELEPPSRAAFLYEQELRDFFGRRPAGMVDGFPCFDLMLLGMGSDGHTASLFPGSAALAEKKKWVAAVEPRGTPEVARITLTLPVLNQAANILFLVAGQAKQTIFEEIAGRPGEATARYPAALVQPAGTVRWLVARTGQ